MSTDTAHYTLHLHRFVLFLLPFSGIFWIWAIINTVTKDYVDLGILSFLTVMITSAYLLYIIRKGGRSGDGGNTNATILQSNDCCRKFSIFVLPPVSHLLVIVNYALGASLTEHLWGEVYCVIFTALWVSFAIIYLVLVFMIRKGGDDGDETATAVSGGDEEVVGKSEEGEMA